MAARCRRRCRAERRKAFGFAGPGAETLPARGTPPDPRWASRSREGPPGPIARKGGQTEMSSNGTDPAERLAGAGADAERAFERRIGPTLDLAGQADAITAACHAMAVRFHQGGKLVVFGTGSASTDAQHVAVEFVHPVIVGKRALPAISLTTDVATVTGVAERHGLDAIFSHQIRYLAAPSDIALGICAGPDSPTVLAGLVTAREL